MEYYFLCLRVRDNIFNEFLIFRFNEIKTLIIFFMQTQEVLRSKISFLIHSVCLFSPGDTSRAVQAVLNQSVVSVANTLNGEPSAISSSSINIDFLKHDQRSKLITGTSSELNQCRSSSSFDL